MRCLIGSLLVVMSLGPLNAQVQFSVDQTIDLSSTTPALYGDYLQLVDVTNDGVRDLLTVDSGNLTSYERQSTGAFVELATTALIGSGTLATVADLDNDGNTDAVVRLTNGYVSMLGDGSGSFTQAGSYLASDDLGQVLIGDFNGDGTPDVVAARTTGGTFGSSLTTEISIRMGTGSGTFGPPMQSDLAGGLNSPVVIDLNEDGTDDLVLAGLLQLTFVFITDGLATSSVDYPAGVGDAPQDIRVQDLNGDGHLDVVFTCPIMNRVGVLVQDGTGGIGSFQDYEVSDTPVTVRAEDINDDGVADLLTTTNSGFEWRLGLGDGSFGALQSMTLATSEARFAVGDSTSDGLAEVAILSGDTVSILLNTTSTTPLPGDFRRGDTNNDGQVEITDAIRLFESLFLIGSAPLECADSGDTNDDGAVDVSDPVYLLSYLFVAGSAAPPAPGVTACGSDPTADPLATCSAGATCP